MNLIVSRILGRASDLVQVEPTIALFVGAALIAVFLTALLPIKPAAETGGGSSLVWTLYRNLLRLTWALLLVAVLAGTISVLRSYLQQSLTNSSERTAASPRRITTRFRPSGARNRCRAN